MTSQQVIIIPPDPFIPLVKKPEEKDISEVLIQTLRESWLNEETIASSLKDIIMNAETQNAKWDRIDDYQTKLSAVKTLHRMLTNRPENQINIANIFSWNNTF